MALSLELRIDIPLGGVYQRELLKALAGADDIRLEFKNSELKQYLDGHTAATIVGLILGVARLILAWRSEKRSVAWSVERLKSEVRRAAIEFSGKDDLTDLRFDGLREFLQGNSRSCRIVGEINDEYYSFIVFRDGGVIVIRREEAKNSAS